MGNSPQQLAQLLFMDLKTRLKLKLVTVNSKPGTKRLPFCDATTVMISERLAPLFAPYLTLTSLHPYSSTECCPLCAQLLLLSWRTSDACINYQTHFSDSYAKFTALAPSAKTINTPLDHLFTPLQDRRGMPASTKCVHFANVFGILLYSRITISCNLLLHLWPLSSFPFQCLCHHSLPFPKIYPTLFLPWQKFADVYLGSKPTAAAAFYVN